MEARLSAVQVGDALKYSTSVNEIDRIGAVVLKVSGKLSRTPAFGVDVDGEDRLYFDQFQRGLEVLRFDVAGGRPERVASPSLWRETGGVNQPVEFPDGRVLLPSKLAGRDRLLAAAPRKEPVPLSECRATARSR